MSRIKGVLIKQFIMNSVTKKSSSFIQVLIDKYIYYVVINKNHKKYITEKFGYGRINESNLKLA